MIAKIEWHPGELFPRVGFIVTNLPMEPDWMVRFYNQRGTAEQHIMEGKYAFRWTRLSAAHAPGRDRNRGPSTTHATRRHRHRHVPACLILNPAPRV